MDELKVCTSGLANNIEPRVEAVTPELIAECSVEFRWLEDVPLEFDITDIVEPGLL